MELAGEAAPIEVEEPDGGRAELRRLLAGLSDRHRAVLTLRFGLGGEGPLKLREVAGRLGCTRQNVHQLEVQALRLLGLERDGGPKSGGLRKVADGGGGAWDRRRTASRGRVRSTPDRTPRDGSPL